MLLGVVDAPRHGGCVLGYLQNIYLIPPAKSAIQYIRVSRFNFYIMILFYIY